MTVVTLSCYEYIFRLEHIVRIFILMFLASLFTTSVHATVFNYRLLDHGGGGLGPDYGLRVDYLGLSNNTFSVEKSGASVRLVFDDVAKTASINGQVSHNGAGGLFDLTYTLSGIQNLSGGGFTAAGGSGNLSGMAPGTPVNLDFAGKQNGSSIASILAFDGHRINNDSSTGVFRGWIVDKDRPCCNDFLVQVTPVPLPATLVLFLTGIAGLGVVTRRRVAAQA